MNLSAPPFSGEGKGFGKPSLLDASSLMTSAAIQIHQSTRVAAMLQSDACLGSKVLGSWPSSRLFWALESWRTTSIGSAVRIGDQYCKGTCRGCPPKATLAMERARVCLLALSAGCVCLNLVALRDRYEYASAADVTEGMTSECRSQPGN